MKRNPIALGIVLVVGLVMAIGSLVISLPAVGARTPVVDYDVLARSST